MNYDKLKAAINDRRKWNMENLLFPNLVNNGLVQALAIIDSMDREDGAISLGCPMVVYSMTELHKIKSDKKNYIRTSDNGGTIDMITSTIEDGEIFDVIYPDGTEELCIDDTAVDIMCEAFGRALLENGELTQEEYDDYIDDPYMYEEGESYRLEVENENAVQDNVVPLFKMDENEKGEE